VTVVDVNSGSYALADDELEAFDCAREKTPEGLLYLFVSVAEPPIALAWQQSARHL